MVAISGQKIGITLNYLLKMVKTENSATLATAHWWVSPWGAVSGGMTSWTEHGPLPPFFYTFQPLQSCLCSSPPTRIVLTSMTFWLAKSGHFTELTSLAITLFQVDYHSISPSCFFQEWAHDAGWPVDIFYPLEVVICSKQSQSEPF